MLAKEIFFNFSYFFTRHWKLIPFLFFPPYIFVFSLRHSLDYAMYIDNFGKTQQSKSRINVYYIINEHYVFNKNVF